MVHCPKCSSPIGSDLPACPICHQPFSDADRETMTAELAAEEKRIQEKQRQALADFQRKRGIFTLLLLTSFFVIPVVLLLAAKLTKNSTVVLVLLVIGLLLWTAVIIGGIVTGAARCPHCGAILFRQYGPHCQSCGGRLK